MLTVARVGWLSRCASPHRTIAASPRHYRVSKLKTTRRIRIQDLPTPKGAALEKKWSTDPDVLPLEAFVWETMRDFQPALLLTRVGKFYESYFNPQAALIAKLLNLKLTSKRKETPFCGFPVMALEKHLKTLVLQHGYHVAICEEFHKWTERPNGERVKLGIHRRVTRVVTPGTWAEASGNNNWLVALSKNKATLEGGVDLACMDVGTGDFWEMKTISSDEEAIEELVRLGAKEVVIDIRDKSEEDQWISRLRQVGGVEGWQVSFAFPEYTGEGDSESEQEQEKPKGNVTEVLMRYVGQTLIETSPMLKSHLSSPSQRSQSKVMHLDSSVLNSLEIRESMQGTGTTTRGSLMSAIRRTVTDGGRRLLMDRLCYPSTDLEEINLRHSLVSVFHGDRHLREDLRDRLRSLSDLPHLVQKLLLMQSSHQSFLDIKNSLLLANEIKAMLLQNLEGRKGTDPDALRLHVQKIQPQLDLIKGIDAAVDDVSAPMEEKETGTEVDNAEEDIGGEIETHESGSENEEITTKVWGAERWLIKPDFDKDFVQLHSRMQQLSTEARDLEYSLRTLLSKPDLTLTVHPKLGPIVNVGARRKGFDKVLAEKEKKKEWIAVLIQSSGNKRRYSLEAWTVVASKLFEVKQRIRALEQSTFATLKDQVLLNHHLIRKTAHTLHELDLAAGFAELAAEHNFSRPTMDYGTELTLTSLRHPVVEMSLQSLCREYVPNDVSFTEEKSMQLITGPNMSGKSSFLRAVAIAVLLAQAGSFVPASVAKIGVVDKIFTRVGARDEIWRDRSTFMIEMMETGEILRKAGERSLVVMDEVGRGSSARDGIAISYASVDHLLNRNKCKTLFATHHHELANLFSSNNSRIAFRCTHMLEQPDGSFAYSHVLEEGVCWDSHGIKVAELAGMPRSAIEVARKISKNVTVTLSSESTETIRRRTRKSKTISSPSEENCSANGLTLKSTDPSRRRPGRPKLSDGRPHLTSLTSNSSLETRSPL